MLAAGCGGLYPRVTAIFTVREERKGGGGYTIQQRYGLSSGSFMPCDETFNGRVQTYNSLQMLDDSCELPRAAVH